MGVRACMLAHVYTSMCTLNVARAFTSLLEFLHGQVMVALMVHVHARTHTQTHARTRALPACWLYFLHEGPSCMHNQRAPDAGPPLQITRSDPTTQCSS